MAKNRDKTTTTTFPEGWHTTIDGWVRDPAIRRHSLIALAMLLSTTALIVVLVTGALAAAVNTLLPSLLVKTIAAGALGAGSTGWWLHCRRRTRRQWAEAAVNTAPTESTVSTAAIEADEVLAELVEAEGRPLILAVADSCGPVDDDADEQFAASHMERHRPGEGCGSPAVGCQVWPMVQMRSRDVGWQSSRRGGGRHGGARTGVCEEVGAGGVGVAHRGVRVDS